MTESVEQSSSSQILRALAMEVELSGVDAIARFKFDDNWKIHEFGAHIDAIPGMTDEYSQTLRGVANLINEPDTEAQALDVAPSFCHRASQERYEALRDAGDLSQYAHFSQSQSTSSQVLLGPPSQAPSQERASSSGSSLLTPAPNQQANRQRLDGRRKSPRPRAPRNLPQYVLDDEGPGKGNSSTDTYPGYPADKGRTIQISTSEDEDLPNTAPGVNSSDDDDEDAMASPQAGTKRQRLPDSDDNDGARGGKGKPSSSKKAMGSSSSKKTLPKRPRRPTQAEIKEMDKASRIPETEPTRSASKRPATGSSSSKQPPTKKRQTKSPSLARTGEAGRREAGQAAVKPSATGKAKTSRARSRDSSMSQDEDADDEGVEDEAEQEQDKQRGSDDEDDSQTASQPSQPSPVRLKAPSANTAPGSVYEGDIEISGPAKASKLGLTLSSGYDGFKYLYSWREGKHVKEKWKCLGCTHDYTCSLQGHNSNLVTHRDRCKGPPVTTVGSGPHESSAAATVTLKLDDSVRGGRSSVATSTIAPSSYRGPSLAGWIGGQQMTHPLLTRRLGLVAVIENALPFSHLRSRAIVRLIKSIDARATVSLRSDKTVRRDLTRFHTALKSDVYRELQDIDTLVSLQHDAWTTKAYQHSFVATIASYVTKSWDYREVLLSFDVIHDQHTGATFSGHLIRTLKDYVLDDKWYGPVTSDSTGVNHRMLDVLGYELLRKGFQQRRVIGDADVTSSDASPSAFPHASARKKGQWVASENKVLCLNHHVNIAVRAGFAKFGIKFIAKTKAKLLDLRPAPAIMVTDENGDRIEMIEDEDDGESSEEEEPRLENAVDAESDVSGENMEEDSDSDSESEEDAVELDDIVDLLGEGSCEEEDFRPGMEPNDSELGSEDEGGPAAEVDLYGDEDDAASDVGPTGAIAKLEAFTVDIHRSPQRRANFRDRMAKEYHRRPKKANAPFPSKPNGTRWNSHWAMIKKALKIRDAIDAHCRAFIGSKKEKFGQYLLSESQWRQLELLKPILRLASAVTKSMEQASGTLYMVLDHHASLRDEVDVLLSKVEEEEDELDYVIAEELRQFGRAMEAKLKKYRDIALSHRLTLAAALLHPLNRMELFETSYPDEQRSAEKALRGMLGELIGNLNNAPMDGNGKAPKAGGGAATPASPLSAARARRRPQTPAKSIKTAQKTPDEVTRYLDTTFCPWRDTDKSPYKWWKDNEELFPNLAKLARLVLAVPGSSSSVERVFSQAALFSTNRRARLSAASISKLVTTKLWLTHGADYLAGLNEDVRRVAKMIDDLPDMLYK